MDRKKRRGLLLGGALLLLACMVCLLFHCKWKSEFQACWQNVSQLEPGSYTITVGVYGDSTERVDIQDPGAQRRIITQFDNVEYDGLAWSLSPTQAEDHVYWLTFFSSEPFVAETWEIGGAGSRNCVLVDGGRRIRLKNTEGVYALLLQLEAQDFK